MHIEHTQHTNNSHTHEHAHTCTRTHTNTHTNTHSHTLTHTLTHTQRVTFMSKIHIIIFFHINICKNAY